MPQPFANLVFLLLSFAAAADAATLYWDGATSAGNPGGGTGTWNTTTVNWDTALTGGTGVAWTNGSDAVFSTAGGVVTLGSAVTASSLNFTSGGYSFALGTRVLTVNGGIFSTLAGNVFSVTGSTGSMVIGGSSNLLATQSVTLSSGILTLQYAGENLPLGEAEILLNGGTFNVRKNGANDATIEELLLRNRLRVTNNVTINADRLAATGGTGKLLMLGGVTIGANTLTTSSANGFSLGFEAVSLSGNATFTTNAETYLDSISETGGARTLTKVGTAAMILRTASNWTGGVVVGNGTLEARSAGAFGSGQIQVGSTANSAALSIKGSATYANGVTIGGTGGTRTILAASGTSTLFGDVAFNRATTVDVGSSSALVLSGVLSGSTVLTKTGPGRLVLGNFANADAFGTGAAASIVVSDGSIVVDDDAEFGVPGSGVRLSGGGLKVSGAVDTDRNLNLLTTTSYVDVDEGVEFNLAVAVTGTGSLTKRGLGAMRMAVAASASGGFVLNDGELSCAAPSGSPFGTGALRLNFGTLSLSPYSETAATATLSASAGVTIGGAARIVIDDGGLTDTGSGNLLATFNMASLTRVDHGTLVIAPVSGTDILGAPLSDGERVRVQSITTSSPFFAPYVVAVDSDTSETPHFVRYSSTSGFLSAASNYVAGFDPNPLVTAEVADMDVETVLANESVLAARIGGSVTISPGVTLSVGGTSTSAGLIFHDTGEIRGGSLVFGSREALIFVAKDVETVIESDIVTSATPGGFTKFGPGSLELVVQSANGNLGEISVQDGALVVASVAALGTGTDALRLGNAEFTVPGPLDVDIGRPVIISPAGGATIRATDSTLNLDKVVSGGIATPGFSALTISGGASVRLSNTANSFAGDVWVDGTDLIVAGQGSADPTVFGAGQKQIRILNNGKLRIESGDFIPSANTKTVYIDGASEIAVDGGKARFLSPNQLAGTGTLNISGSGSVEVGAGQGDFQANVVVQSGTLIISGGISGTVTVRAGGTLEGSASTGALSVEASGRVSPGGISTARLTVDGLSFEDGGIARFDIDSAVALSGYDQLSVVGSVTTGGADLSLELGYAPTPMLDLFFLILNDGNDPVTGAFSYLNGSLADLSQNTVLNVGGQLLEISYTAESGIGFEGVGNDIALRSVPEPGTLAFGFAGLLVFTRRRIRR